MDATEGGAKDNVLVLLSELAVGAHMSDDAYGQLHDAISAIPEQGTCTLEWDSDMEFFRECSACGFALEWEPEGVPNYCPGCGAKVVEQ